MSNDWILDVLADLKSFALRNNLSALAEQLDDTTLVAATEIASKERGARSTLQSNVAIDGRNNRGHANGQDA